MNTRAERLNLLCTAKGFGYEESDGKAALTDDEGSVLCALSAPFVKAVADCCDDEASAILSELRSVHVRASGAAFDRGVRYGREKLISTVHELLGIDRIAAALEESALKRR